MCVCVSVCMCTSVLAEVPWVSAPPVSPGLGDRGLEYVCSASEKNRSVFTLSPLASFADCCAAPAQSRGRSGQRKKSQARCATWLAVHVLKRGPVCPSGIWGAFRDHCSFWKGHWHLN